MLGAGTVVLAVSPLSTSLFAQSHRIVPAQRSLLPGAAQPWASPDEARDLLNAGQDLYDDDKFIEAEKKFRQVVSRFPRNVITDRAEYYPIRSLT